MVWEIMLHGGQRSVQTDNATPEPYGIVVTQPAPGGGGEVETIHPWHTVEWAKRSKAEGELVH